MLSMQKTELRLVREMCGRLGLIEDAASAVRADAVLRDLRAKAQEISREAERSRKEWLN